MLSPLKSKMIGKYVGLFKNRSARGLSPVDLRLSTPSLERVQLGLLRVELTTGIVAAYVQKHFVPTAELAKLIASVHEALDGIQASSTTVVATPVKKQKSSVSIQKSVTDEFIICLEDGERFKSMKGHLGSKYNLTPDQYRAKWGLSEDYPMVAPAYSEKRSQLARDHRFGQKRSGKTPDTGPW